jgi:tetratricopeptide (TPR) repeat protein/MinD-like ATPase involved in chromosome partitioning or flagellar assembly
MTMHTVTFYSYKGGTGRTLALANVSLLLAHLGFRVVVLDFDLEAPGLPYKLLGPKPPRVDGVVGWLRDHLSGERPATLEDYVLDVPVDSESAAPGQLRLMPAGRSPSPNYFHDLRRLRLEHHLDAGVAVEALIDLQTAISDELRADFLLIDARTGVTSTNAVTTHVLADQVVVLTLNTAEQLEGTRAVLRGLKPLNSIRTQKPIGLHIVVSRIQPATSDTPWAAATSAEVELNRSIIRFFNEPAVSVDRTLDVQEVHLLHTDLRLLKGEALSFARVGVTGPGALHGDYTRLARAVFGDQVRVAIEAVVASARGDAEALEALGVFFAHEEAVTTARGMRGAVTEVVGRRPDPSLEEQLEEMRVRVARDASHRPELASLLSTVSARLVELGHHEDAFSRAVEAIEIYRPLAFEVPEVFREPLTVALLNGAQIAPRVGNVPAAIAMASEAVTVRRSDMGDDPDSRLEVAVALEVLASTLRYAGRHREVVDVAREAVALCVELVDQERNEAPAVLPELLDHLAVAEAALGELEAAITTREFELAIQRAAAESDRSYLPAVGYSLLHLAMMCGQQGLASRAAQVAREALELWSDLDASGRESQLETAHATSLLASALADSGEWSEALAVFQDAVSRMDALDWRSDEQILELAAELFHNFAFALGHQDFDEEALAMAERALEVRRRIPVETAAAKSELVDELLSVASYRLLMDRVTEGLTAAEEAVGILRELADEDLAGYIIGLVEGLTQLGALYGQAGRIREATHVLDEALELATQWRVIRVGLVPAIHVTKGLVLQRDGRYRDALAAVTEGVEGYRREVATEDSVGSLLAAALSIQASLFKAVGDDAAAKTALQERDQYAS